MKFDPNRLSRPKTSLELIESVRTAVNELFYTSSVHPRSASHDDVADWLIPEEGGWRVDAAGTALAKKVGLGNLSDKFFEFLAAADPVVSEHGFRNPEISYLKEHWPAIDGELKRLQIGIVFAGDAQELTDRHHEVIQVLKEADAIDEASRITVESIAKKASPNDKANNYRKPCSELVGLGRIMSKRGPKGGLWLSHPINDEPPSGA